MKKLLFIIAMCIATNTFAQSNNSNDDYHPLIQEGKVWTVSYNGPEHSFGFLAEKCYYHYTFSGDTCIDEKIYYKVYSFPGRLSEPPKWSLIAFMREDQYNNIWIRYLEDTEELLYYSFSLQIGDIVPGSTSIFVADITYTTLNNGEKRKTLLLSDQAQGLNGEFWIEGLGSNKGIFSALTIPEQDRSQYSLKCYYENEILLFSTHYMFYQAHQCFLQPFIGINSYQKNTVNIFPNPANGELRITNYELRMGDNWISDVEILDITGRRQKAESRMQNAEGELVIDISHLKSGIYFLVINNQTFKVIKN
ncbi:MAG: T9SS type A sorting domain-containing protein [Firmicutes bacterium]|nr:T9SS type A sorting domain-containing protein [Bacillota bacterium]